MSISQDTLAKATSNLKTSYVFSLPLPDSCTAFRKARSKISTAWWNDPHPPSVETESYFATDLKLTYTVSTLEGFTFDGKPYDFSGGDEIVIAMLPNMKVKHKCDHDSRHAFHALVQLFSPLEPSFTYY